MFLIEWGLQLVSRRHTRCLLHLNTSKLSSERNAILIMPCITVSSRKFISIINVIMKRLLSILSIIALTSCATAYQQIASVSSPQMTLRDDGKFRFNADEIIIDYNFWAQNGQVSFIITNDSDRDVYVDLGRSFLVVNGMTFDYYQNRTYTSNASSAVVRSSSYGASNTFAVANVMSNAFSSSLGNTASATAFSNYSSSSNTFSSSRRSTTSNTINRGIEYVEKECVWVPAHTSRHFCEFSLLEAPYRSCGLARNPSKGEDASVAFTETDSPYAFDNMLMLVIDGEDHRLVNSFYIDRITNILRKQTYDEEDARNCDESKTGEKIHILRYISPNRFYINYEYKSSYGDNDRLKKGTAPSYNRATVRGRSVSFDDGIYNN